MQMKKTNVAGFASILSGGLLWGYRALSNFMGASTDLQHYGASKMGEHITLYESLPEGNFDWINSIPWPSVKSSAEYVVNMPLWLLLIISGGILLIIGGIFIKK
jgi:hypothetical protein